MYCYKCGKELGENVNFCPYCGAEQKNTEKPPEAPKPITTPSLRVEPAPAVPAHGGQKRGKGRLALILCGLAVLLITVGVAVWKVLPKVWQGTEISPASAGSSSAEGNEETFSSANSEVASVGAAVGNKESASSDYEMNEALGKFTNGFDTRLMGSWILIDDGLENETGETSMDGITLRYVLAACAPSAILYDGKCSFDIFDSDVCEELRENGFEEPRATVKDGSINLWTAYVNACKQWLTLDHYWLDEKDIDEMSEVLDSFQNMKTTYEFSEVESVSDIETPYWTDHLEGSFGGNAHQFYKYYKKLLNQYANDKLILHFTGDYLSEDMTTKEIDFSMELIRTGNLEYEYCYGSLEGAWHDSKGRDWEFAYGPERDCGMLGSPRSFAHMTDVDGTVCEYGFIYPRGHNSHGNIEVAILFPDEVGNYTDISDGTYLEVSGNYGYEILNYDVATVTLRDITLENSGEEITLFRDSK